MRGTNRILISFGIVFAVVSIAIGLIVWQTTNSMMGSASRMTGNPSAMMSSITNTIVWTIVPIVAITAAGIVIFFVFVRRILGGDRKLLATGIAGTAVVLAVRDTGVTINNINAVLEATLQVTLPGQAPYEAKTEVTLGRMNWGALQPGMTVAVKVDPKNPTRVAIDWNAGRVGAFGGPMPGSMAGALAGMLGPTAAPAMGGAGMVMTPGGNFQLQGVAGTMQASAVRTADDVIAQGQRAEGTIHAVSHTGATAGQMVPNVDPEKAGDPMVYVAMQVQPRGGAAFAAQGIYRVPKHKLGVLAIGRRVPVAYLPGQPQSATIDWSRI